ncbi:hypothetical protein WME89_05340 [Sorangium sp. So ce321]|uniref:hypothetical protein n=1 Tax=Sorangium sp. So ce321 TaxID=3133300 RepID=UPI003F64258E
MRSRSAAARLFMVSTVLAGGAVARAQTTAAPLRIEYRAEAGCPTEAEFRARVGARLRRQLGEADAGSAYVVTIDERDGRFTGRLGVRAADGAASDRDVAGATCDDVVAALAVVTALAIDSQAAEAAAAAAAPAPSAPASAAAGAEATGATTVASPSTPSASARAAPAPPPPADSGRARPPGPATDAATHLTLGAQLLAGEMIGAPSLGARLFAEPPLAAMDNGVGPLRFGAHVETSSDVPSAGGSASFLLAAVAADACPVGAALGALRLAPCARVEGGLVAASLRGVAPARGATRGWLALALPLRARLPVWGPFLLDAEAGVRMPLLRDGLLVDGAGSPVRPPPIEAVFALGLGLTIP